MNSTSSPGGVLTMSAPQQTLTLANDLAEITRLAAFVDTFCAPLPATPKDLLALHLTLEELVTNVISHGYTDGRTHTFTVALAADNGRVTAIVDDDAPAYDPLSRPEVDTSFPIEDRPIGGLGVHLVRKLMDTARYERRDGHNRLTLQRTLGQ